MALYLANNGNSPFNLINMHMNQVKDYLIEHPLHSISQIKHKAYYDFILYLNYHQNSNVIKQNSNVIKEAIQYAFEQLFIEISHVFNDSFKTMIVMSYCEEITTVKDFIKFIDNLQSYL